MKRYLPLAMLLAAPLCHAQSLPLYKVPPFAGTRVLVGGAGGVDYNNYQMGVTAGIEVPFARRFELDLHDTFSPYEGKPGYGSGHANNLQAGGIIWLTNTFGVRTNLDLSQYSVSTVTKSGNYVTGGLIKRLRLFDAPARLSLSYLRQVNNGISNGIESSHMQGGIAEITSRIGCSGRVCWRLTEAFSVGHVLQQGNCRCDGSCNRDPNLDFCRRKGAVSGGFTARFEMEWPGHRGNEGEVF